YGFDIQFVRGCSAVDDPRERNLRQILQAIEDVTAAMRFHASDHNIKAAGFQGARVFQHLVSLPDTGSVAQINLEMSAGSWLCHDNLASVWKDADVDAVRFPDQAAHRASPQTRSPIFLHAVSYKNLRDSVRARVLHNGLNRIVAIQDFHASSGRTRPRQV